MDSRYIGIEELPRKKPKQKRRHVQTEARKAQQAKYLKRGYHGQQVGRPKQQADVVARIRGSADESWTSCLGFCERST